MPRTDQPSAAQAAAAAPRASIEFLGTATTILRLGPFTLLTDPNFQARGERAYLGYGLFSKRLTEPALQPEQLPPVDAVVLSHLHADHFDRVARMQLSHDLPVVTTPQAARRLGRWGFANPEALMPWQIWTLRRGEDRLTVTACPGQHGPAVVDRLLPQVMGSVIEWHRGGECQQRLYISGDTLCRPYLAEVAERFGDLDTMVVHLGGTRALGVLVTMDAEQGADLMDLVRPRSTIPIHYDDYTVFRSPLAAFTAEVDRRGQGHRVRTIARGQTLALGDSPR